MTRSRSLLLVLWAVLVGAACDPNTSGGGGRDISGGGGDDMNVDDMNVFNGWDLGDVDFMPALDVQPSMPQTITVAPRGNTPTLTFSATLGGQPVSVAWSVDRGDIGTVVVGPGAMTTFTPRGTTGGTVNVIAGFNGMTVRREITVQVRGSQNGVDTSVPSQNAQVATSVGQLTAGGGVGGVGGEGLGGALSDATVMNALGNPTAGAGNLTLLYPYDGTVWPRGLPAPLLQWRWDTGDADGIKIELSTDSGNFQWTGIFGRPAILASVSGGKFIRHPIPQDVWELATNSAGGRLPNGTSDKLTMKLTVAKGGTASGPITQTWIVAPARLSGTIYYNSYGTALAKNYTGAVGGDGQFGGAVLRIRVGDAGPQLAAGANGTPAACRVCHSVAADGSRLVAPNQSGAFSYAISPTGLTETAMATYAKFPGITPDGKKALTSGAQLLAMPGGTTLATTGLTSVATSIGTPSFSPAGTRVAFNPMNTVTNATQKLIVMSFENSTNTFMSPQTVVDFTGQPAETRPGWPAFLPDGNSLVFHHQTKAGNEGNGIGDLRTRRGAMAHISWAAVGGASPVVTGLNKLNGVGYLPKLPGATAMTCTADYTTVGDIDPTHDEDVNYNYEPTVNPVASGGYVWVVFTSRRMYGSVAAIPPFCSDPRGVELITGKNITTKKLWVAAIDVSGNPSADASHPAFYLPGQELIAGNSRGFWVLDPCRADGASCDSGDQCCGGYCQPNGTGGALICSNTPPNAMCSQPQERCDNAGDCCDPTNLCVNGFCTANTIP
jgi:predicted small secreted protein